MPAGTIFRTINCLEVKGPWNHSIQGGRDLICCYWSSEERAYAWGWREEFLCWAFVWGREGGCLGLDSWVCDLQTLRALCCEIHSFAILKFLTSFKQGTHICTRPCKFYIWYCVQGSEPHTLRFKFWYSLAIDCLSFFICKTDNMSSSQTRYES